jgi:hypothetical protein
MIYKLRDTVKLGYSNIGFCDTLSIASNIMWKCPFRLQRYSFITTLFLGPFDDVITEFYCIIFCILYHSELYRETNKVQDSHKELELNILTYLCVILLYKCGY